MPEAWRALGYSSAGRPLSRAALDTTAKTTPPISMATGLEMRSSAGFVRLPPATTRPAAAQSWHGPDGDGHLLWKTSIDPAQTWGDDESWTDYEAKTFALPDGDLDGDGTCDVFVTSQLDNPDKNHRARRFPLELLSGRTGRHLWSAGNLPLDRGIPGSTRIEDLSVCKIEPDGAPAILAMLNTWVRKPGATSTPGGPFESRLTRLSGRDGRVVWDKILLDPMHPVASRDAFVDRRRP